jgi:hypothetical protein
MIKTLLSLGPLLGVPCASTCVIKEMNHNDLWNAILLKMPDAVEEFKKTEQKRQENLDFQNKEFARLVDAVELLANAFAYKPESIGAEVAKENFKSKAKKQPVKESTSTGNGKRRKLNSL